ncbi:MAG: hypothetical protein V3W41_13670, partial [Planctomycetota bacterium]
MRFRVVILLLTILVAGVLAFAWSWLAGSDAEDLAGPSLSSWEAPFSAEKEARRPSSKQEILG